MTIERWRPFRDPRALGGPFGARHAFGAPYAGVRPDLWAIPLDVHREGDDVVVSGALPGVAPSDIEVTIEDGVLTIEGQASSDGERENGGYLLRERRSGAFRRSLRLPDDVDADNAASSYAHGVVTVRLPKTEGRKARRLTLDVAGGEAPAREEAAATA